MNGYIRTSTTWFDKDLNMYITRCAKHGLFDGNTCAACAHEQRDPWNVRIAPNPNAY
jgi:hypothetical protein